MALEEQEHRLLAFWAADCAGRVLPFFEQEHPGDGRPRSSVETARAWARGETRTGVARAAAVAARAAARDADGAAARAAARAAGHAAATAHMAAHARHAAGYAVRAAGHAGVSDGPAGAEERGWQRGRLPERLRPVVFPGR